MEKSTLHFRAAHPLLFISSILLSGIFFAHYLLAPHYSMSSKEATAILIGSLLTLLYIIKYAPTGPVYTYKILLYNTIIFILLFIWGILLFYLTKERNIFQIPYPEKFILLCRNAVIHKINTSIYTYEANAYAQALLLGVKTDLNKEITNAYKQLGIIHIIAISGMHLEIIFKNISRLTQWLPHKKIFLILELFIIISSVWIYTLMAFASPSIVRAAVFFSIYYIGRFLEVGSFTLNTIAGAVLILLLFDLKNIENIGLQLSYAAVMGIHLFFPVFNKMLPMDNPLLVFLWSNLCVSLAAQLTTLPILLFHFHQIASLVLVSNFIMVPLSTLLLYALVILVLTPSVFGLPRILGEILEKYIIGMNKAIRFLDSLPINHSLNYTISLGQVFVFYLGLLVIYGWLYTKKAKWLVYFFGLFCIYNMLKLFSQA
jgi:competence protein ComEC